MRRTADCFAPAGWLVAVHYLAQALGEGPKSSDDAGEQSFLRKHGVG